LCAIKQARAIAAIIAGQRGEKGREKPAIDREDRESQTGIRDGPASRRSRKKGREMGKGARGPMGP